MSPAEVFSRGGAIVFSAEDSTGTGEEEASLAWVMGNSAVEIKNQK
jgi:hypothetical protein